MVSLQCTDKFRDLLKDILKRNDLSDLNRDKLQLDVSQDIITIESLDIIRKFGNSRIIYTVLNKSKLVFKDYVEKKTSVRT